MQTKVCEWENNQGVRLSEDVLHAAGFALNEVLNVQVSGGIIILTKKNAHKSLEERAAEFDGDLGLDGEYEWGEPVGREGW